MNFKYLLPGILIFCVNTIVYPQDVTVASRPDNGVYFISRNTIIDSSKYKLYYSIRAYDKKDINDTTVTIKSNGEGWLDKDSLPVGEWLFFSIDETNKSYLLKKGKYLKTEEKMFAFTNDDHINISEYGFTPESLQKDFSRDYPFIKTGTWYYYHPNGKIWKQVLFESHDLFLDIVFVNEKGEFDNEHITKAMISEKEKEDEWPKEKVDEYNADGYLFKKVFFAPTGRVIVKEIFDNTGKIIHEYSDFHGGINSTNF
jgi:hypothetical protein